MGGFFEAGAGTGGIAAPVAAVAVAACCAVFLRLHLGRYGRIAGWPGRVTQAVLLTGIGVGAYAVWPLPGPAECAADPLASPFSLGALEGRPGGPLRHAALAFAVLVPVGLLARHRYRRGVLATAALGALTALAIEAVQATGVLGALPCAHRVAAVDDVLLGTAGALAGWLLGLAADRVLPRPWPGGLADIFPPGLGRRAAGHLIDLALWWYGTLLAAALIVRAGYAPLPESELHAAALIAAAVLFGLVQPVLRGDRCTPGRACLMLATAAAGPLPEPASRPRVLVRSLLLYAPVTVLFAAGLHWWALLVPIVHGLPALARADGAGLADLICGTRTATRAWTEGGGLPAKLIRYAPPAEPRAPAPRAG
ncbi:VanZ family protein [Nocardiopsis potens]|uniref:VanZ family protein n=1 Tax=Nocardiopsis potens TaxID=1246458 RepID=UPI00034C5F8A|nr:VanZ family protein [Nocardiopsis potens]